MPSPPNILIVMSDQHAHDLLGCAGDPLVRTPNLDRLAAQGIRFDNAYCPSPLCVPSRMSFMTGRYPAHTRVWTNEGVLSSGIPTWAHTLGTAGYQTTLIGRMHFLGPDQRHGFMDRLVGERQARFPGVDELGGPRYTRMPRATAGQQRASFEYAGRGHSFYQQYDADVTNAAIDYLRQPERSTQPFAAVVGGLLPHCPYIGPKEAFNYYYDRVPGVQQTGAEPACVQALQRWRRLDPPATDHQVRVARAAYYAMIEYLDANVGRLLDTLDETGLARNTLVVYCSDHGDMMGEHGLWSKKCFYERAVRVPLIARLPGVTRPGTGCDALCSLVDIAPTLAELAGAAGPDTDGASLVPLLAGDGDADRVVVSEVVDRNGGDLEWAGKMLRHGQWKLWQLHPADGETPFPPVLFDLDADPGETTNLAEDPNMAPALQRLSLRLHCDWQPADVLAEVRRQFRDWQHLEDWGRALQPPHPDTYVWPGPETEADLELLSHPQRR